MSLVRYKTWLGPTLRSVAAWVWPAAGVLVTTLFLSMPVASSAASAQTAEELAAKYGRAAMEQALQTKQRYDLYGIHFDVDKATIQANTTALLDDIATTLKSFPDWRLRIVGHTDSTGDAAHNQTLSLARADAIKTGLIDRGIDASRLDTAGSGQSDPVASNDTPEGRALNRRVELVRLGVMAENAKRLLKAMSEYLAAQKVLSFDYDATLEVVTKDEQKLALASSGAVTLNRPDKIRAMRAGGFADVETSFDGKTVTVLGKNRNIYAQIDAPGTLDQLIDELRSKYGRHLPAANLLLSDPYDAMMQDVVDIKDLGSGVIGGVECDYLAFRKRDIDWQIWIAQGERPYPCRYTLTTKNLAGHPQYTIQIRDWKTGKEVAVTDFSFKNTTDAKKVELKNLEGTGDLPAHFKMGEPK